MIFGAMLASEPMFDIPDLARDWFGLGTWALLAIAAVAAAFIWRQHKGIRSDVDAVKGQVVNGHSEENLRTQLDRIESNQVEFQKTMTREISGLRKDIGRLADSAVDDRAMHHQDVARLDDGIDELRKIVTGNQP